MYNATLFLPRSPSVASSPISAIYLNFFTTAGDTYEGIADMLRPLAFLLAIFSGIFVACYRSTLCPDGNGQAVNRRVNPTVDRFPAISSEFAMMGAQPGPTVVQLPMPPGMMPQQPQQPAYAMPPSVAAPMVSMHVTVPPGSAPGSTIAVAGPDGKSYQLMVPHGVHAGQVFSAQLPAANAAPMPVAQGYAPQMGHYPPQMPVAVPVASPPTSPPSAGVNKED